MSNFFTDTESGTLVHIISEIEKKTDSELRIHIEDTCEGLPYERAVEVFNKLEMYKTKHQTGILIYIATVDKKLAILGDKGIHSVLETNFWDLIIEEMKTIFQADGIFAGVKCGLNAVGEKLIYHFPETRTPTDELTNELSYGKI